MCLYIFNICILQKRIISVQLSLCYQISSKVFQSCLNYWRFQSLGVYYFYFHFIYVFVASKMSLAGLGTRECAWVGLFSLGGSEQQKNKSYKQGFFGYNLSFTLWKIRITWYYNLLRLLDPAKSKHLSHHCYSQQPKPQLSNTEEWIFLLQAISIQ